MQRKPSYLDFDKTNYAWKPYINYKEHPNLYQVGRGEQGVLICEPYKSTLVALWRFKTPAEAKKSSAFIYREFLLFLKAGDFVGADMARKFLQMGFTRARRYANYKGGKKYEGTDTRYWSEGQETRRRQLALRSFIRNGSKLKRTLNMPN
ncbi:MAG: DUF4385 family protein [Pseudomonadota bacterium]